MALIADLQKAKPATAKGQYLKRVTLSSTMGPGVIVDQGTLVRVSVLVAEALQLISMRARLR